MKESFYFRHDYNARTDPKVMRLMSNHGLEGYGAYWMIIEMLASETGKLKLPRDYEMIGYSLRLSNLEIVISIIEDYDLFEMDDKEFWSDRLLNDHNTRMEKSDKARENAKSRWDNKKKNKTTHAEQTIFYVIRIYNDKEEFLKAGITKNSVTRRFSGKLKGYEYEIIYENDCEQEFALECERSVADECKRIAPLSQFPGYLECYSITDRKKILDIAMRKSKNAMLIEEKREEEKIIEKKKRKNKNTSKEVDKSAKAKDSYGKPEINNMLEALKFVCNLDDFSDTKPWQRIYAQHMLNLKKKIGEEEFTRRLQVILNDAFKRKRRNSLKFLYSEIKSTPKGEPLGVKPEEEIITDFTNI